MNKIKLSADCACDIGPELQQKYGVEFFYFHLQLGNQSYLDTIDITPNDIYSAWETHQILPTTSAITPGDYYGRFAQWVQEGYEVIHLNMGSALTCAHQNCRIAAEELKGVYTIDTGNLSAGIGIFVLLAGEMIEQGYPAGEICQAIREKLPKANASFIVDTFDYLKAGGRCSALTAMGASLLKIKPTIEVCQNEAGKLNVGKKYRGSMEAVLKQYAKDRVEGCANLDLSHVFITHSGSPDTDVAIVKAVIEQAAPVRQIHITSTSCTIAAHCGPRTLGILLMEQ